jgi:hypothetical protein
MGDSLQEILARPAAGKRPTCRDVNRPEEWKDHVIRLYFQNVNGLRLQDAAVDITETFLHLKNIEADIFGLVETQLHCRNPQVQRVLQDCKRRVWDQCKLFSCSTEEDWATQRKPGGTLVGVTGSLVGRVRKQYHDKYGRWTRIDLLGRDGRTLTIICAYQVVQESGVCGDKTTYSQQIRLMRLAGIREPSPRKIFIQDLKVLVKFLHSAHHDVILMGDFNELIGAKPSEMASVINAGHLTDTYCFRHGLDRESATYARGTKRVDYVLVSHCLTEHIRATGAEPFNYRIFSDHRGLFVDFALPGFFDRACNELVKHPSRDLIFDCPRHVKQYLLEMSKYMESHKIVRWLDILTAGDRNDALAESIDKDITRSMVAAEATCKSTARAPWSKALHKAMNKLFILKRVLSQHLTGIDMTTSIRIMQSKMTAPVAIPVEHTIIQSMLRQAR